MVTLWRVFLLGQVWFFKKRETARQRKYLFVFVLVNSIACTDSQILVYIKVYWKIPR